MFMHQTRTRIQSNSSRNCTLCFIQDLEGEDYIILGGDINCPLNPSLDKRSGMMIPRKAVIEANECLRNELDLVDIWRVQKSRN